MVGTLRFAHPTLRDLLPHRQRDQTERADDDAPPGEQGEAVAGDVSQETFYHDGRPDERYPESDPDEALLIGRHVAAGLLEAVGEPPAHGRGREKKREIRC